jgi:hypothetical protein
MSADNKACRVALNVSLVTGPAGNFVAEPLAAHVFGLIAHARIVYQIEHSALVQAVISTLLAARAAARGRGHWSSPG